MMGRARRRSLLILGLAGGLLVASSEVPRGYATRQQIVDVAAGCGVEDFEPTRAGAAWAAYVRDDVPHHEAKENCIYATMRARDLLVTR